MIRLKRATQRLLEIFDYRTFVVAGAFVLLAVVGAIIVQSLAAAHDATVAANQRGAAASRRIDKLNTEIQQLQAEIAADADARGQLAAAVNALRAQVLQLGGQPVASSAVTTVVVTVRPAPQPTASATPPPSPRPRPTATTSPTPSPTCTRLLKVLC